MHDQYRGQDVIGNDQRKVIAGQVAKERSAIEAELSINDNTTSILHDVISDLTNKLAPVLHGMKPVGEEISVDREMIGTSEFYGKIYRSTNSVDAATARLRELIRELEV